MTATSLKSQILATAAMALAFIPAAAVLGLTPQASAQTAPSAASESVYVGDISRADAQSLETVRSRVETAARKLCAETATHSPLFPRERSDCQHDTVQQALNQLEGASDGFNLASAD